MFSLNSSMKRRQECFYLAYRRNGLREPIFPSGNYEKLLSASSFHNRYFLLYSDYYLCSIRFKRSLSYSV